MKKHYKVLTIAGSDSSGGAGIQADLKTCSALGCYGMTVITALTAQNTQGVQGVLTIDADFVAQQLDSVLSDIDCDAVKIGMLHSSDIIKIVAAAIKKYSIHNIVLDPVFVAKDGSQLIKQTAIDDLKSILFGLVDIITPNLSEAEIITGKTIRDKNSMISAAQYLAEQYQTNVLLKGGHLATEQSGDVLYLLQKNKSYLLPAKRIDTKNTHGTGCTLSAAIAAYLARGENLLTAVEKAKLYINDAIQQGARYQLGQGYGPVHHFYELWQDEDFL